MEYQTHSLQNHNSISWVNEWTTEIVSWFHERREKNIRNRAIRLLLTRDERLLNDIGVSRSELVGELGHDPGEMPKSLTRPLSWA